MNLTDRNHFGVGRTGPSRAAPPHFLGRPIDDAPHLLEQSYRLRYEVYCLERKFLPAEHYPAGLEMDEYDCHSLHVGAVDASGALAGTSRAVKVSALGLPLFDHCTAFPHEVEFHRANSRLVEVGRLVVDRRYRRRGNDAVRATEKASRSGRITDYDRGELRRVGQDAFMTVLEVLYDETRRIGATHWLTAMQEPLRHQLVQHGFPFRAFGPESEYYGLVIPYQMALQELDDVILSGRFPGLEGFGSGHRPALRVRVPEGDTRRLPRATVPPRKVDMTVGRTMPVFGVDTEARLLTEFRRAAADVPAYRTLLAEHGVRAEHVTDLTSFTRHCPVLSKRNTFDRFRLEQLSVGGALLDVADVLTSSGHGGRFSFGVISRTQVAANAELMDRAFDDAFSVKTRKTLTINCLPMGVVFSSHCMTVATTSVREDMAVALVETFGHHYDQIVLCGDPLFMKRLTDYARERGIDWSRHRVNIMMGEEIFGEHFRGYLAACVGLNLERPEQGSILSSFGVGELGLHLCYETPATIRLRRASLEHPAFARDLLGAHTDDGASLPMIFTFNPLRTFIEVADPDGNGYGPMTTSMLDPDRTVPFLRYQTGDIVRLLDRTRVTDVARRHGVTLAADLPQALLALRGREREALPNGSHVGFYKDALYVDHRSARLLTGAFRTTFSGEECTLHVQLVSSQIPPVSVEQSILHAMPSRIRPARLVLWPYARFPFGMTLDYERKFVHYVPGEQDPCADGHEPRMRESPR